MPSFIQPSNESQTPLLLTARQASDLLGLSVYSLLKMARGKALPSVRLGSGKSRDPVFFKRADLENFIETKSNAPTLAPTTRQRAKR